MVLARQIPRLLGNCIRNLFPLYQIHSLLPHQHRLIFQLPRIIISQYSTIRSHTQLSRRNMTSSDESDEDFKTAVAMSLSETATMSKDESSSPTIKREVSDNDPKSQNGMTYLGLDRKSMEEQRLARLKRKLERPISPPEARSSRKAPKLEEESIVFSSGARLNMISTVVEQDQQKRKSLTANAANKRLKKVPLFEGVQVKIEDDDDSKSATLHSASGALKYPKGVVKKTWAFGHERNGNDIKLEEVLEPLTLKTAVLSAFQWDTNWVLSKLKIPPNGGNTKCIFVMQGKEVAHREEMLETAKEMRSFLRLCFPPMEGQVHCMHSKLMLLFHAEKLRIAVPTANLLNFDWGETGVMENSVFMIDLPRLPSNTKTQSTDLTPFGKELLLFLEKQGLDSDVCTGILNFDFSATAPIAFVHTIGGTTFDREAHRTGLAGLSTAVRALNLATANLEIDFAASSIGSLNDTFLANVLSAARGENPIVQAESAATSARTNFFAPTSSRHPSNVARPVAIREKMRIYFPTRETVSTSTAGAVGTICLSRNWYEAGTFPRSCFRDYKSTREGLLSHNKILCARGKRKDDETGKVKDAAWVYVGSANMSESAWGKVSYNKKRGDVRINCRNWECGVLLPVSEDALLEHRKGGSDEKINVKEEKVEGDDSETESEPEDLETSDQADADVEGELVSMDVFKDIIDLPFRVPGERYGSKEPWYFKEHA